MKIIKLRDIGLIIKMLASIRKELICIKMAMELSNLKYYISRDDYVNLLKDYERKRDEEDEVFSKFIKDEKEDEKNESN